MQGSLLMSSDHKPKRCWHSTNEQRLFWTRAVRAVRVELKNG